MNQKQKISRLQVLLEEGEPLRGGDAKNPAFIVWKNSVIRTLTTIFGQDSHQAKEFNSVSFSCTSIFQHYGEEYLRQDKLVFQKGLQVALMTLESYIKDLKKEAAVDKILELKAMNKIFISHASKDVKYVEEVIELLRLMGLNQEQIFCSSVVGYGIPLGTNFLSELKKQISEEVLVLFVFTPNFYASAVCMAELGACWALSKDHIPIIVPPFRFSDINSVLPHTQGLEIDDSLKINQLLKAVTQRFNLPTQDVAGDWDRSRDRIINRLKRLIKRDKATSKRVGKDSPGENAM